MKRSTDLILKNMLLSLLLFTAVTFAYAEDASPAASPGAGNQDKVKELKDKLATKVAELRQEQKRGIYGEVKSLGKSSFVAVTANGEVEVKYSEDTAVFDLTGKRAQKDAASLKNAQKVAVLGYFDEKAKETQAKVIFIQTSLTHYGGEITETDKTKGTLTIKQKNEEFTYDYERSTVADEYSVAEKKVKKSGLSRLATGDFADLWATVEGDTRTAVRILRVPKEALGQAVPSETATSPEAVPTKEAEASPKATPKPSAKASPQAPKATP